MKPKLTFVCLVGYVAVLLAMGCGQEAAVDATVPLQQSFQTAEPQVRQSIQTVTANLQSQNYVQATRALAPVVTRRRLTEPQKEAVGMALQQINQAIAADPSLDTQELYRMRVQMFRAVDSGPRF